MARWFSKRWIWAALAGTTVAIGLAAGRPNGEGPPAGPPGPPKVGTTLSLNIDGKGERQFKVTKSDRQPDGTYLSELKDTKTGETITLVDKPNELLPPLNPMTPESPKAPAPTKAKAPGKAPAQPPAQPVAATMPDPPGPREKEKRPIFGRLFGDKDKTPAPPPGLPPFPGTEMPDSGKKPGLFGRVFGPKKPTGPSMPAPTGPVVKQSPSAPPAVIPTPTGGLPPFPVTGVPSGPGSTAEPPRVLPTKPAPVAPAFPAPSVPVPSIPSSGSGFLPIPVPGGASANRPLQMVVPAGYIPAGVAYDRDVQPFVVALQTMDAPSARLTAAKGLAEGRHASSDGVKAVLFQAARMDPCAEVRAACIDHLCKLGYFNPHFLGYIQGACEDVNPMVSAAAKTACAKMIRK